MTRHLGRALIVTGISLGVCLSMVAASQDQQTSNASKLRDLLTQRRDTLKRRFEFIEVRFKERGTAGNVTLAEYVAARDQLLMAELELAEQKPQRLELLKQRIENFRSLEVLAQARFRQGTASKDEEWLAKANRLQAEIDYIREESKTD